MTEKTAPLWGDFVHVSNDPSVVIDPDYNGDVVVASESGVVSRIELNDIDEYACDEITVGDMRVTTPAQEAPVPTTTYWLVTTHCPPIKYEWHATEGEYEWLRKNLIHLTFEDALDHQKALIRASGGSLSRVHWGSIN